MFVVVKYPGQPAEVREVDWSNDPHGCLDFLKGVVGGKLELVRITPKFDMWINEEGKIDGLEPNLMFPGDVIVGPVVIAGHKGEDTVGLELEDAKDVCAALIVWDR